MNNIFGFPIHFRYRFVLNGRHYRVSPAGVETLRMLIELYEALREADRITWLLPYRDLVRQIEERDARATLSLVVSKTTDPQMRLLAVWLRGRCGGYTGAPILSQLLRTDDYRMRKEVVRALKRIHGWGHLQAALLDEPCPRIRRLGTSRPPREYRQRLSDFAAHVSPLPFSQRLQRLWVSPEIKPGQGRLPKPIGLIRHILENIRSTVGLR